MAKLVIDIETTGLDFESFDQLSQDHLLKPLKKETLSVEEYQQKLTDLKDSFSLSPLTGKIIALGLYDLEKNLGTVFYEGQEGKPENYQKIFTLKPASEPEMLQAFWQGAKNYDQFITFNGRGFDIPFLLARSAIHKVKASKDLMSNRYPSSQRYQAKHLDLYDLLSFFGASRYRNSLHLWCQALGITSPKADGISGEDVPKLYRTGRILDIAKYNSSDLLATAGLYRTWADYIAFD